MVALAAPAWRTRPRSTTIRPAKPRAIKPAAPVLPRPAQDHDLSSVPVPTATVVSTPPPPVAAPNLTWQPPPVPEQGDPWGGLTIATRHDAQIQQAAAFRHRRTLQRRPGRLAAGLGAACLLVTALAGGYTTSALWNNDTHANGFTIQAGDLAARACTNDPVTWQETTADLGQKDASLLREGPDLPSLKTFLAQGGLNNPDRPGDSLEIDYCVETYIDGDNLDVDLELTWQPGWDSSQLPPGVSATYQVKTYRWTAGGGLDEVTVPLNAAGTVFEQPIGTSGTAQHVFPDARGPSSADRSVPTDLEWHLVVTVSWDSQTGFDYVDPRARLPIAQDSKLLPDLTVTVKQVRSGAGWAP